MDIRVSDVFTDIDELEMFSFDFSKVKDEDGTLVVFAHQGWWNYGAEIIFNKVLFMDCPERLHWNIRCRLATEEEARRLRRQRDISEEATIYCFHDISVWYMLKASAIPLDFIAPKQSFVIAHSVKIVAFKTDSNIVSKLGDQWQKGDFYDLSEPLQQRLLCGPSTAQPAMEAKSEAEKARTNHPDTDTG